MRKIEKYSIALGEETKDVRERDEKTELWKKEEKSERARR